MPEGEVTDSNLDSRNVIPHNDTERMTRTLVNTINQIAPEWLNNHHPTTEDILSLGAGLGYEQNALKIMFPNAKRTGIDRDTGGQKYHEVNGAAFIKGDITDPNIYTGRAVRLIICRNPGPATGTEGIWKNGFELAWKKLKSDGIFYVTTTKSQLKSVKDTLQAAGITNFTTLNNTYQLKKTTFTDEMVIIAHKKE